MQRSIGKSDAARVFNSLVYSRVVFYIDAFANREQFVILRFSPTTSGILLIEKLMQCFNINVSKQIMVICNVARLFDKLLQCKSVCIVLQIR
jgi:hypothetical protein